jgi:uncharacterized FlaG/YvyC family protein
MNTIIESENKEEWKLLHGQFNNYMASSKGRIIKKDTGKVIKQKPCKNNLHMTASLKGYHHKYKSNVRVHKLVASVFVEKKKAKSFMKHIDGNTKNNRVENLRWVEHSVETNGN